MLFLTDHEPAICGNHGGENWDGVFWIMRTYCCLADEYQRFGGVSCFHLQGSNLSLNFESTISMETSVNLYESKRFHSMEKHSSWLYEIVKGDTHLAYYGRPLTEILRTEYEHTNINGAWEIMKADASPPVCPAASSLRLVSCISNAVTVIVAFFQIQTLSPLPPSPASFQDFLLVLTKGRCACWQGRGVGEQRADDPSSAAFIPSLTRLWECRLYGLHRSRDSSVGIVTGYGLEDRGVGVRIPLG
jgi:hypothetical protein